MARKMPTPLYVCDWCTGDQNCNPAEDLVWVGDDLVCLDCYEQQDNPDPSEPFKPDTRVLPPEVRNVVETADGLIKRSWRFSQNTPFAVSEQDMVALRHALDALDGWAGRQA